MVPFPTIHSEKTVKSSLSSSMMSWLVLVSIRHEASVTWEEGIKIYLHVIGLLLVSVRSCLEDD